MQWVRGGHKPVIGHHSEKSTIHGPKNIKVEICGQAACIEGDSAISLDVHSHLRDGVGDETNTSQGQVGKEEVHGGVEVRVGGEGQWCWPG